jgi:hypothetical protein
MKMKQPKEKKGMKGQVAREGQVVKDSMRGTNKVSKKVKVNVKSGKDCY